MRISPHPQAFVFDLDGTLIDSVPGIACALRAAFASVGRVLPSGRLRAAIGPPIREIALRLEPTLTELETQQIERVYRAEYDGSAWQQTRLFPGVRKTLQHLRSAGHRLSIVTNKPSHPTFQILERLELSGLFCEVLTRDSAPPCFASKSVMLADLLRRHSFRSARMVGDTREDAEAAQANGLAFTHVTYGYGRMPEARHSVASFRELGRLSWQRDIPQRHAAYREPEVSPSCVMDNAPALVGSFQCPS